MTRAEAKAATFANSEFRLLIDYLKDLVNPEFFKSCPEAAIVNIPLPVELFSRSYEPDLGQVVAALSQLPKFA